MSKPTSSGTSVNNAHTEPNLVLLLVEVFVCEIVLYVVRNAQCTLARVATTTPLLSVSRRQPELHALAVQYAARLVVACVVGCGWDALPFLATYANTCLTCVCRTLSEHPRV